MPLSWDDTDPRHGGTWVPSRRFGVVQNDKIRPVDDLSESLINSTVTETEKITLEGLDEICCLARFFAGATTDGVRTYKLPTEDGTVFSGELHADCHGGQARRVQLDLKSAYKQLACHPDDRWASVIAALDVESDKVLNRWRYPLET